MRNAQGSHKRNLLIFTVGLSINLIAIMVNIWSQITSHELLGEILDVIFFFFVALAISIMNLGFLRKSEQTKKELISSKN